MHFPKAAMTKLIASVLFALCTAGCAATYVPVTWGLGDKVRDMAEEDPMLVVLFRHCDPTRRTVRFNGASFNEVMMPAEVKHHLGAYRPDTGLIYRNLEYTPNDKQLRDLIVHELAHHCWFTRLSSNQRLGWQAHLQQYPSPLQEMVRSVYPDPRSYDTEDFAFTVEKARPVDIQALVSIKAISETEGESLLQSLGFPLQTAQAGPGQPVAAQPTPGKLELSRNK